MRILIVDDSRQSKFYLENRIKEREEYKIIAMIEDAANAELYCIKHSVDMILMDVCTANNSSGIEAAGRIRKNYPNVKVIIITSMPEHSFIKKARAYDCNGFWYKEYDEIDILEVMDKVAEGNYVYPKSAPEVEIGCTKSSEFSPREFQIVRLLADGMSRQEIADELGISSRTVRFYIDELKAKTGHDDTMKMVADFVEKKLIINGLK
ncbi:MAG: response regulator transcription factor [Lachnospiraceae bacterium]|nr:response regulator transcription factor [Lachnospiraceae bacterium]